MNKKLTKTLLGDVCQLHRGYDLPNQNRIDGPYPVISSSGISGMHHDYKCGGENVITGRYGTIGEVYYYNGKCWPLNTALFVSNFFDNYPKYIYYFLKCTLKVDGKDKSTVPGVDRNVLHALKVSYFSDKDYQIEIASVLSCIDAKIDLNAQLCAELEAMAKTLYDYWFVQFDFPDENGKPYRTSGGAMEKCKELGREVPKGWKAGTVVDLGEIVSGATPSTTEENYYTTNGIAWITPNDLSDNEHNMFVFHGERDITEAGLSSCSAILMPAGSVLMSSRAPIGYLAIAANPVCTNQGFKSIICTKDYGTLFVYYTLKRNVQGIARQGVGTTFKEVSRDTLARYTVLLPDTTIAKHFEQLIAPISQTRKNCEQENRELIALRDWLLPMLMNGQAKVE